MAAIRLGKFRLVDILSQISSSVLIVVTVYHRSTDLANPVSFYTAGVPGMVAK